MIELEKSLQEADEEVKKMQAAHKNEMKHLELKVFHAKEFNFLKNNLFHNCRCKKNKIITIQTIKR